jgi:Rrf2 family protein
MPMHMSTRGRYGVRLMVALALDYGNETTILRDVARREGISEKYLGQIIIPLKSAGLVVSQRGSRGGYALARDPACVTVKDVVEAIEGRIAAVLCVSEPQACARATSCVAAGVWRKLSADIEGSLASFSLAALARQARELARSMAAAGLDYQI